MTLVHLRRAGVPDAAAIAQFQTACWNDAYAGLVSPAYLARVTADVRESRWRDRLAGSRGVIVAEDPGIVGVASWVPGELCSLYVARSRWGTGVADSLLRAALGDSAAFLWVFEANVRARAFYARHRFVDSSERAFDADTGLREIRMSRQ